MRTSDSAKPLAKLTAYLLKVSGPSSLDHLRQLRDDFLQLLLLLLGAPLDETERELQGIGNHGFGGVTMLVADLEQCARINLAALVEMGTFNHLYLLQRGFPGK